MAKPRPGKYDAVIGDLQPAPPADPPYQARVDEAKKAFEGVDVLALAKEYVRLRKGGPRVVDKMFEALKADLQMTEEEELTLLVDCLGKDGIERLEKACNLRLEAATQLLAKSQDEGEEPWGKYGVKPNALRLEDGGTIRVQSEPYGQVKDKEAFRLWCKAPVDVCMTCGGDIDAPHHVDNPSEGHTNEHRFKPGGGYERQLQLWPATMNAIVKERCVSGDPYPDGTEAFRRDVVKFIPAGGSE